MTYEQSKPLQVFMPGCYGRINKGDTALARSFTRWLSEDVGANRVVTTSFDPAGDAEDLGVPVLSMVTRPGHWWHRGSDKAKFTFVALRPVVTAARLVYFRVVGLLIAFWGRLYLRSPRLAALVAPAHVVELATEISRSELVFAVPGGYLLGPRATSDSWLFHVPTFELAAALQKPIALGPCSVGPFHPIYHRAAIRLLDKIAAVCVREEISRDIINMLDIPRRPLVLSAPDMAFWFARETNDYLPDNVLEDVRSDQRPILGVSVRRHYFPGSRDPDRAHKAYLTTVAQSVADLAANQPLRVWIIPQTHEDLGPGRELSQILSDLRIDHLNRQDDLTFEGLRGLYAQCRLLLGTRMHANILAMTAGTPVAAIAYEPKTTGILESMGLSSWGLDIDDISDGRLSRLVARQWAASADLRKTATDASELQAARIDDLWDSVRNAMADSAARQDSRGGRSWLGTK